jgi:hypothetical protein
VFPVVVICVASSQNDDVEGLPTTRVDIKTVTVHALKSKSSNPGSKGQWIKDEFDNEMFSVEECALDYYAQDGWTGVHCENSITTTLFGLLFWDVIFAPIPRVFQNAFQTCPLDMETEWFYPSRRTLIDQRLDAIRRGDGRQIVMSRYADELERKTSCSGVNWEYPLESLTQIMDVRFASGHALLMPKGTRRRLFGVDMRTVCQAVADVSQRFSRLVSLARGARRSMPRRQVCRGQRAHRSSSRSSKSLGRNSSIHRRRCRNLFSP